MTGRFSEQVLRQRDKEIEDLRRRLEEAEGTLRAIRSGEVDAIVVSSKGGERIYTLKGAEYSYRVMVEQMGEGALTITSGGTILYCNRRLSEMVGIPLEKVMGMNIGSIIAHADQEALEKIMKLKAHESKEVETSFRHADGTDVPVRLTLTFLPEEMPPAICIIAADMTEIRRRETESMREREVLEERVAERTADLLAKKEELEAAHKRAIKAMEESNAAREKLTALNKKLKTEILKRKKEAEEREKIQAQLFQSQKMEAIGSLAGGIAHDFNNLLTTIIGNAQLALTEIPRESPLFEEIEEIKKAGDKAVRLTQQLLAFGRKEIRKPEVLNLNHTITDMEKMLRRLLREDIEFQTILEPNLHNINIDPAQIDQVIMNLVVNAKDAMPDGGKLTIETGNVELDRGFFQRHGVSGKSGQYVMLAVSDTGVGMDKKLLERIFEPFFTTKERGIGTGLGLSTVHGIVNQNGGHIWAYSEPGRGTTMKVYLPKAEETGTSRSREKSVAEDLSGSETVLLAEDDDNVRSFAKRVLLKYGYKVLESKNGEEAIKASREFDGKIDLLLTDVVMPGMKGKDIAERLKSEGRDLKVLFMSGYTHNIIMDHGIMPKDIDFIEKPFSPVTLARKIREILNRTL